MERNRIAIVGSGISGLSALWTLRNTPHDLHLFEADDRLGGHTNTLTWTHNGKSTPVDTGFIVLNTATYPNFIAFLKELEVKTIQSEMTFGVSRDAGAFEWSGTSLSALFAQPTNALKPTFWRMIFDIIRFNQFALDLLSHDTDSSLGSKRDLSIGEYLAREGYSDAFRDDYLIPMTACVWSTGPDKCALEFPALTLVRFMWNHHLLSTISERPPWLTIAGGAKTYIDAVTRDVPQAKIHLSTPVISARNDTDGRVILSLGGTGEEKEQLFDEVILACHGDTAFDILRRTATPQETDILSAFTTTPNTVYLHSDTTLMPHRRTAWSAWNYLTTSSPDSTTGSLNAVSLTYNMNILQSIPKDIYNNVLVTMNPPHAPLPHLTQAHYTYTHPLYTSLAVSAQEALPTIQGKRRVWYAGAWTGYGFHEDGFASGMRVGLALGGDVGWEVVDAKFVRGRKPVFGWRDWVVRVGILVVQLLVVVWERVVGRRRGTTGAGNAALRVNAHVDGNGVTNGKAKAS